MATRLLQRFGVEGLEDRQMLSGGVMPYGLLTLKGHFVAGAPTTVTFAGKHEATITVTPASVTKGSIVVAVPAFFDPKSGQPVAATAAVSVAQEVGGHSKSVRVLKGLSIARLPLTGLGAGDVLGAVTVAAQGVTADAANRFAHLLQNPTTAAAIEPIAPAIISTLDQVESLIPQAQQALVALASGAVGSVPLGTFQGRPATLDAGQLGVLDRIVAAGIDDAAGSTSLGYGLIASLDGLVLGAESAGPAAVIGRAIDVVDVLSTATGSPVVPPGSVVTGLAIGSLSAVVAAAEAEVLVIQGAFSPTSTLGPADIALVDRVLDDPALGQALNAITSGLVPTTPAGQALIVAVRLAESLAAEIDPNVPGSAGSDVADLPGVLLHAG